MLRFASRGFLAATIMASMGCTPAHTPPAQTEQDAAVQPLEQPSRHSSQIRALRDVGERLRLDRLATLEGRACRLKGDGGGQTINGFLIGSTCPEAVTNMMGQHPDALQAREQLAPVSDCLEERTEEECRREHHDLVDFVVFTPQESSRYAAARRSIELVETCLVREVPAKPELRPVPEQAFYTRWLKMDDPPYPTDREQRAAFGECLAEGFSKRECEAGHVVPTAWQEAEDENRKKEVEYLQGVEAAKRRCSAEAK